MLYVVTFALMHHLEVITSLRYDYKLLLALLRASYVRIDSVVQEEWRIRD